MAVRTRSNSAVALLVVLGAAGCGGGSAVGTVETTPPVAGETAPAPPPRVALRVGLVRSSGGLNARALGEEAANGLRRAAGELGIEARTLDAPSRSTAVQSVAALAGQGFDLVFGVGTDAVAALDVAAPTYPTVRFAAVDASVASLRSRRNVVGLTFRVEQAAYLAGYLAGLVERSESGSKNTIGWVGAAAVPPVERYAAGYETGARAADPAVTIVHDYAQTFTDPAKCKEFALKHLSLGSDIELEAAGRCGRGVLETAVERNVWAIGAEVASAGPHILTSAVKHVDVAVLATIRAMQDRSLRTGIDTVFDAANGGVGLGPISTRVPPLIVAKLRTEELRLTSGRVPTIPTATR